jgi:hypothetical protein
MEDCNGVRASANPLASSASCIFDARIRSAISCWLRRCCRRLACVSRSCCSAAARRACSWWSRNSVAFEVVFDRGTGRSPVLIYFCIPRAMTRSSSSCCFFCSFCSFSARSRSCCSWATRWRRDSRSSAAAAAWIACSLSAASTAYHAALTKLCA